MDLSLQGPVSVKVDICGCCSPDWKPSTCNRTGKLRGLPTGPDYKSMSIIHIDK